MHMEHRSWGCISGCSRFTWAVAALQGWGGKHLFPSVRHTATNVYTLLLLVWTYPNIFIPTFQKTQSYYSNIVNFQNLVIFFQRTQAQKISDRKNKSQHMVANNHLKLQTSRESKALFCSLWACMHITHLYTSRKNNHTYKVKISKKKKKFLTEKVWRDGSAVISNS